jgi:hypothetical protein
MKFGVGMVILWFFDAVAISANVPFRTKPHDFAHYLGGRYWWNHATVGSITCRNGSPAYTS